MIFAYVHGARHTALSEHEHYGPYSYLKLMTWHIRGIDRDSIHGSLEDLTNLACAALDWCTVAAVGDEFHLGKEYAQESTYSLVLALRADGFDPAFEDATLRGGT